MQFEQLAIPEEASIKNDVSCTRREHLAMVSRESHEIDSVQPLVVRKFAAICVCALHSSEFAEVGGPLSVTTEPQRIVDAGLSTGEDARASKTDMRHHSFDKPTITISDILIRFIPR